MKREKFSGQRHPVESQWPPRKKGRQNPSPRRRKGQWNCWKKAPLGHWFQRRNPPTEKLSFGVECVFLLSFICFSFVRPCRDNDRSSLNCASMLKGGWWWKSCGRGLNGIYLTDPQDLTARQGKKKNRPNRVDQSPESNRKPGNN